MKRNTLILIAGTALITASVAHTQESGRLAMYDLNQGTPLIHWPKGFEPSQADAFVHNEGWIDASPEIVWANLIDAVQWPSWYSNSADVRIEGGQPKLGQGVTFSWKTFGFPIRSTVDVFRPNQEIGWGVDSPGFAIHHAWVLIPERGGTRVITEESQKGAGAIKFRLEQPNAMYDGHDWWMSALKVRSERMARPDSSAPRTAPKE